MNYRHQYHAGNFADVFKHTILITLLSALSKKEKPWCYLDTHAGRGRYDLFSEEAKKTKEFENGIGKIFPKLATSTFPLGDYHHILTATGYPHYYPGSPRIAYQCMRPQDSLILIEKHPEEMQALKNCFYTMLPSNANIAIHQKDGYQAIKAFLPPKERRGLILIDPPFEQENEWQQILNALSLGLSRFANGIYAIWYPIKTTSKTSTEVMRFHIELQQLSQKANLGEILIAELCIYPEDVAQGLKGAGMVILNPPWQIEIQLQELLKQLFESLSVNNQGRFVVKFI